MLDFDRKLLITFNILISGNSYINAGCGNCDKKITIDLDNFTYDPDIIVDGKDGDCVECHMLGLSREDTKKIAQLNENIIEIDIKKNKIELEKPNGYLNDVDYKNLQKQMEDKYQEINKLKSGKFYFYLERVDRKCSYTISCKKTDIDLKNYVKVTNDYKGIIDLIKKFIDSIYEGGQKLTVDEGKKLSDFLEKNKELFILYKVTYLEKKIKGSDKNEVVEYKEIIDIFRKK